MELKVNIPEELAAQARARGVALEAYVEEILAQQVAERPRAAQQPRTAAEIRAWLDSLAQFSDKIPPLPESISREWIYQDPIFPPTHPPADPRRTACAAPRS